MFLAIPILAGCNRQPETHKLDVDVFIVTKGSENVKLGLVAVTALPLDAAKKAVQKVIAARVAQQARVDAASKEAKAANQGTLDRLKTEVAAAALRVPQATEQASQTLVQYRKVIAAATSAAAAYEQTVIDRTHLDRADSKFIKFQEELDFIDLKYTDGPSDVWYDSVTEIMLDYADHATKIVSRTPWEGLPEQRAAVLKAAAQLKTAMADARKASVDAERIKGEYRGARDAAAGPDEPKELPGEFFDALPYSLKEAKMNADGRCSLLLPPGQWVVAARANRQLPDGLHETYVWIVPVEGGESVILSNDNLLHRAENPLGL